MPLDHVDDVAEMLIATQPLIMRDKPAFLATDLQKYHALDRLMRKDRAKVESGTGTSVELPVVLETANTASGVGLTEPFSAQFGHTAAMMDVPWRHSRSGYAYIRQLIAMNSSSPERIYNYLTMERNNGWMAFYKYLEQTFWGLTLAAAEKDFWGLFNWIVYNATDGFTGGVPTGYSTVAGISHDKWKNYSATYTNLDEADFMQKAWNMKLRTGFESPEKIEDYYGDMGDQNQYYVNRATFLGMKTLAESRNENLGFDLGPDRNVRFSANKINWVPAFDGEFDFGATILAGSDPFIQLDWSCFGFVFLKGEYLREDPPAKLPDKPNCFGVPIDLTCNTFCSNRRKQGIMAKSAPTA